MSLVDSVEDGTSAVLKEIQTTKTLSDAKKVADLRKRKLVTPVKVRRIPKVN